MNCTAMSTTLLAVALLLILLQAVRSQAPGNVRLRGGFHVYEGRVEIFLNGQWGTICDNSWSQQDAIVTCKQLGFLDAIKPVGGGYYGPGDGEILLSEMGCNGEELSLITCDNGMKSHRHNCSHDQDAGVVCLMEDMIRLVGDMPNQGRLEIYHDNSWGTVCHDQFDDVDGEVVCKQLGYSNLTTHSRVNETAKTTGRIWLDDVSCVESNARLSDCSSRGWGITDCHHSDTVNVVCAGVPMEPHRPTVVATTCTNTILHWRQPSADNGHAILRYYIRYRPKGQSEWTYIIHHLNQPLNVTLNYLTPAMAYEVAIAANNMVGNSSYSRSVTMVTQEIAFDPPKIVGVTNGGSGILHVHWKSLVNDHCGLSANIHLIEYSDSVKTYHQLVEDATTNITHAITGLTVNVKYNISVRVGIVTEYGYVFSGPSKSVIAVSVPIAAPVVAPGHLSTLIINTSSILFSWQCTEEYKTGYMIACYRLDGQTVPERWTHNITDTTSCLHLEHDLTRNVEFACAVASFNEIGFGVFSNPVNVIVTDSIPWNPVPDVTQLSITANSVTIAIDQGSHDSPNGYVVVETIGYDVTCRSRSALSNVAVWGSVVTITVDKLLPEEEYTCDIVAINKYGVGNITAITVTTPPSAPTGTPRHLFIIDQVDASYLHWLPPATDQQNGVIIDYNVSCVVVEEGQDPYEPSLHHSNNTWRILVSQLGYHPGNNKSINVAMPTFTPFQLLSCRVASINKNGQGPYKYHVSPVNPSGIITKVEELQANVTSNDTIVFQWQPLANSTKLAVIGYLLQCDADNHTWQHTVWDPMLSMATVQIQQFLTTQQYNCSILPFNPLGFGLHSDPVQVQIHDSSSSEASEEWYSEHAVIYILLSLIGATMVTIILLLVCLCYCTCHHRNRPYSGKNEITDDMPPTATKTVDDAYPQPTHYESLDNLYDKTPPPNNKLQAPSNTEAPSNKLNTSLDDYELPAEEEYMKMTPSRSCSHATIKSETLRSCEYKLNQMNTGTNPHYNSLPNHYSHYDVPPNNSYHSNTLPNNHYDTPKNNKLANTK